MNLREILTGPEALRLGWTLVHFLWQGAALALLLGVLLLLLRRRAAGVRYVSACVVLLLMALAPAATYGILTATAPEPLPEFAALELDLPEPTGGSGLVAPPEMTPATSVPVEIVETAEPVAVVEPPAPWHAQALKWIDARVHWVVAGWFIGVVLLSARLLFGWLRVRALRRSGSPVEERFRARAARLAQSIRLSRPVRLLGSTVAKAPVVIGWLRPVILMPASLLTGLSPAQLDAILAHELAHIRRYDYLVNLAQTVVETLLFYHPAVHWVSRRIRIEREHCCDDLAVSVTGDSDAYARTLVRVAALHVRAPRLVPAAGGHLLARIRRLLLPDAGREHSISRWVALVVLLACALALGSVIRAAAAPGEEKEDAENVAAGPPADYSILGEIRPEREGMRLPTEEEAKALGDLWPDAPPEENGLIDLLRANQLLLSDIEEFPEPPGSEAADEPYAGDAAGFIRYVRRNEPVLKLIEAGIEKETLQLPFVIDATSGTPMPGGRALADLRNVVRFLSDAGFAAELEGRPAAAAERYLHCMRLGNALLDRPGAMIGHLVGIAVQQIACRDLERLIGNAQLDEQTLRRVMEACQRAEITKARRLAMLDAEMAYGEAVIAARPEMARVYGENRAAYHTFMRAQYGRPLFELLQDGEALIKEVRERFPGWAQAAPATLGTIVQEWARANLQLRALRTRAALAIYAQQHGAPPQRLDALLPELLEELPRDPFTEDAPLRYEWMQPGWRLWSVGGDGRNDGGGASLVHEKRYEGPDYVFASPIPRNIARRSYGAITEMPGPATDAAPEPSAKTQQALDALDRRIEGLAFFDTPLPDVLNYFKMLLDNEVNVLLDPAVAEEDVLITLTMNDVTLRSALNAMLRPRGLDYVIWSEGIYISTPERIRTLKGDGLGGPIDPDQPDAEPTERTKQIQDILEDKKIEGFSFFDNPLTDVLNYFKMLLDNEVNVLLDPQLLELGALVTLTMKDATLAEALPAILKPAGLDYTVWSEAIFIATPERIREVTGEGDAEPEADPDEKPAAEADAPLLQFRLVDDSDEPRGDPLRMFGEEEVVHVLPEVLLSEEEIASAETLYNPGDRGGVSASILFTDAGAERLSEVTERYRGRRIAIVFDGMLLAAPVVKARIGGGRVTLDGPDREMIERVVGAVNDAIRLRNKPDPDAGAEGSPAAADSR